MNSLINVICLLLLSVVNVQASDNQFQAQRDGLELKATATATWMVFISVYDAALYAPAGSKPSDVLTSNMPLSLEIVYRTAIKKSQLIEAADVALSRQHNQLQLARFQQDVEALHSHYVDVEKGDRFRIDINANKGLVLRFNDKPVYQNKDMEFAHYYVGLWLAEKPLSDKVRTALLDWDS